MRVRSIHFTLFLVLFSLIGFTKVAAAKDSSIFIRKYRWNYKRQPQTLSFQFRQSDYFFYKRLPRTGNYADFTREPQMHLVTSVFARALKAKADNLKLSPWETVNYVVSFVQGMKYISDKDPKVEYAKFPAETLVDAGGDCEDSAILLAALLDELGYGTILISPPGHMALGIACADCTGSYIDYKGRKYYYTETTSAGWKIGELPYEHSKNFVSKVYPVTRSNSNDAYVYRKNFSSKEKYDESLRPRPWPGQKDSLENTAEKTLIISGDGKVRKMVTK
jgi:hypothetical protein